MAEQPQAPSQATARKAEHRKRQRRLLITTGAVIVLGVAAWQVFNYMNGAPERAEALVQQGLLQMGPGHYAEAIPFFDSAISTYADTTNAYYQRALANEKLGNLDQALEDYQRVVAMEPSRAEAQTAMANIYHTQGNEAKALEAFSASLNVNPTADAYTQRGMTYAALGRHQEAVDDFTEALILRRDAPYVYLARANSLRELGKPDEARADEETAASFIRILN